MVNKTETQTPFICYRNRLSKAFGKDITKGKKYKLNN
jgi:hypothetical protein